MSVTRWVVLLTTLSSLACRSGQPGAPFAGALLLQPPSDAEAAHDELLRADIARSDSVGRMGFAEGLANAFTSDVVYLRGGLPIIKGRQPARVIAASEGIGTNATVRWQPLRAETSRDRKHGYSYGFTIYSVGQAGAPSIRVDRYIAFWRREEAGWRIAAYAETYGSAPPALPIPSNASEGIVADVAMRRRSGALEAIRSADEEFSKEAVKMGTGEAFGRYAAPDAQMFSGPGEFVTGPGAIAQLFGAPGRRSLLVWHPVEGEVAKSEDLGFTVGNAVFSGEREDGAPIVSYSKYLTVWKRQPDGSWKFVVDGGSARPGK